MSSTLKACLERVFNEAPKNSKELRETVKKALEELEQEEQLLREEGVQHPKISADGFWQPFKLACQPNLPPKVREVALDSLQKLIAHQLLRGAIPLSDATQNDASTTDQELSTADAAAPTSPTGAQTTSPSVPPVSPTAAVGTTSNSWGADQSSITPRSSLSVTRSFGAGASSSPYPPNPFLIDEIIQTVCSAFNNNQSSDENVQLQVLKVLLTAVTSTGCEVHDVSLLKVIQTCFNIHLFSKNPINQVTAKASLTQMVNLIFSRMERYAEVLAATTTAEAAAAAKTGEKVGEKVSTTSASTAAPVTVKMTESAETPASVGSPENGAGGDGDVEQKSPDAAQTVIETEAGDLQSTSEPAPAVAQEGTTATSTEDDVGHEEIKKVEEAVGQSEEQTNATEDAVSEPVEPKEAETPAIEQEHDQQKQAPGAGQTAVEVPTGSASPAAPTTKPEIATTPTTEVSPYDPTVEYYNQLLRKDVFLVFRLLCRLSIQTDNHQTVHDSPGAPLSAAIVSSLPTDELSQQSIKARTLALELILSVLTNCGPILQSDDLYVHLVRQHLCLSISRNGIATHPMLFELSLSVFLMIIRHYRSRLKPEIEILLNTVYLHILEMGNSTYKQKSMVLQGLLKICENAQTVTDIF
ncbi:Brefeldin A-inhibited guanine nucleotide-exchange protein 1, partial [Quaeritorhiza haematococci]